MKPYPQIKKNITRKFKFAYIGRRTTIINTTFLPKDACTSLSRIMVFCQYMVCQPCEPWSLQPACIKFSNFMPILDTSIVTTRTFITSGPQLFLYQIIWNKPSMELLCNVQCYKRGVFNVLVMINQHQQNTMDVRKN